jgi:hypothetical protein
MSIGESLESRSNPRDSDDLDGRPYQYKDRAGHDQRMVVVALPLEQQDDACGNNQEGDPDQVASRSIAEIRSRRY